MYESLAPVANDLTHLKATLASPMSHSLVKRATDALETTAKELADATQKAGGDQERSELQILYRGFVAARRIVAHLHELQTLGQNPR
ncbi:type III secretion system protein [Trinickia sp. Y13]|uniref:type III secretion system protein n=1 Tax=Trinickia sp. Y13 TaxID=2917807 RepID=UPI0024060C04|nr:type III secretion system protein [Trinickia sp. Y13]MDG0025447.1 type III secretion system protein [Trinickia sp. Y13]